MFREIMYVTVNIYVQNKNDYIVVKMLLYIFNIKYFCTKYYIKNNPKIVIINLL